MTRSREFADLRARQETSLGYLLIRAGQEWNERALRTLGTTRGLPRLREAHTKLVPLLMTPDGIRLTEIAKALGVTKQAVQPLISELVAEGLVEVLPDAEDRRARRLALTSRGLRLAKVGTSILEAMEAELSETLGAKRTRELKAHLKETLGELLRKEEAKKRPE
jgi:DNA-binding MarR family transcriptional regulator